MLDVLKQFRIVIRNIKTHYQDVEKSIGVSGAQLWALSVVAEKPGIKVGELASELAIHQSTASNLIERLTQLGFIERRREDSDQRVVSVYLTQQGESAIRQAPKPAIGLLQNALLTMDEGDLADLHESLHKLITAIGHKGRAGETTPISMFITGESPASK
ncbi:MAG: MarR family transcriptional regulator [Betaproteobacteria bacterium]|nr:MarR family transcriptional regulator [Betaproteobacteria bacterium]